MNKSKKNLIEKLNNGIPGLISDIIDVGIIFLTIQIIKHIKNRHNCNFEDKYTLDDIMQFENEDIELIEPIDIKKLNDNEYSKMFLHFYKKLKSLYPKEDLVNLEKNIDKTEIIFKRSLLRKIIAYFQDYEIGANYDFKTRKIKVYNEFESGTIYHELYHMASHKKDDKDFLCGLSQSLKDGKYDVIGEGINEGYTEVLSKRYFKAKYNSSYSYEYLENVARKIELIIGEKTMSHYYLTSDLYSFIMELSKYSSTDETLSFMSSTDYILDYESDDRHTESSKNRLEDNLKYISEYIIKAYTKKLIIEYKDQDVSCKKEMVYKIKWILDAFKNKVELEDETHEEILNIEDVKKCIQDAFLEDIDGFEKKRTKIN